MMLNDGFLERAVVCADGGVRVCVCVCDLTGETDWTESEMDWSMLTHNRNDSWKRISTCFQYDCEAPVTSRPFHCHVVDILNSQDNFLICLYEY